MVANSLRRSKPAAPWYPTHAFSMAGILSTLCLDAELVFEDRKRFGAINRGWGCFKSVDKGLIKFRDIARRSRGRCKTQRAVTGPRATGGSTE